MSMPQRLILYHEYCFDGIGAAWAARQHPEWKDAELLAVNYGQAPPDVTDCDVLVVDFSYPRAVLLGMAQRATSIMLLDHHRSAETDLAGLSVRYIPLANGSEAIVDAADLDAVLPYSWTEATHGGVVAYAGGGRGDPKQISMHALLIGTSGPVDHINRNPLDNRRANLRHATKQQNAANMDRGSRWKGVSPHGAAWIAGITVDGRRRHLGSFSTPEDAARAYDSAALQHFGAFARGNFIIPPEPPPLPPRNLTVTFDMDRSGAGLTWDCLHSGTPRPCAIDYIEDRDLWRHRLPYAAEVQAWMRSFPTTYESIEQIVREMAPEAGDSKARSTWLGITGEDVGTPTIKASIMKAGSTLLRYRRLIIEKAAEDAVDVSLLGYKGRAVNFGVNELYSEVAETAGKDHDFGMAYKFMSDGKVYVSLRSRDAGADVSRLAKLLGGGGHKHAAAAQMPRADFLLMFGENEAWERGNENAAMDSNENAPFASVNRDRGLTDGHPPTLVDWLPPEWLPDADWPAFRAGYLAATRLAHGSDWEQATWGWKPALTLTPGAPGDAVVE